VKQRKYGDQKRGNNPPAEHIYEFHHDKSAQYASEQTERHRNGHRHIRNKTYGRGKRHRLEVIFYPARYAQLFHRKQIDQYKSAKRQRKASVYVRHGRAEAEQLYQHAETDISGGPERIRRQKLRHIAAHILAHARICLYYPFEKHLKTAGHVFKPGYKEKPYYNRKYRKRKHDYKAGNYAVVDAQSENGKHGIWKKRLVNMR